MRRLMRGKTLLLLTLGVVSAGAAVFAAILLLGRPGEEPPPAVPLPVDTGAEDVPLVPPALPPAAEALRLRAHALAREGTPEAQAEARRLYLEIVDEHDPDHAEARRYLGHVDFEVDVLGLKLAAGQDPVPEAIANRRDHDFLDAVRDFHHQRWLRDPADVEAARAAVAAMREHLRRLETDHRYRLGDGIRANVAQMPTYAPYNYETRWAPPFLICYASKDRASDFELARLRYPRRRAVMELRREKRRAWARVLDDKEAVFTQLYREFLRRFGERLDLRDLSDPSGGRPDLPEERRHYPDGVPLVVWLFTDERAFDVHYREVLGEYVPLRAPSHFNSRTAWVFGHDLGACEDAREREVRANLRSGAHQLLHWFTRQRTGWRAPPRGPYFFGDGLAGLLSAVRVGPDSHLEFEDVNTHILSEAILLAAVRERVGLAYPLLPLRELVAFGSYRATGAWIEKEWGIPPSAARDLLQQQGWMLLYFLLEFDEGRYREAFHALFDAVLTRETREGMARRTFERCLGLRGDEDWRRLEAEYEAFVREDLLKRNVR